MLKPLLAAAVFLSTAAHAQAPLPGQIQLDPSLLAMYQQLHSHPELSHHEEATSALLAQGLRAAGYTVTDHVGIYPDGTHAFGVVGILKNGPGPQVLIRGDMDALPIIEETGVPYASHVTTQNASGQTIGVMHACGHDIHTTVLLGTAQALAATKSKWHGTAMIIGQPSEESIDGAKAMLADSLYQRFGTPDRIIGLHDTNLHAAGTVGITSGPAMASSTSIDVTLFGIGGHGSAPNLGRDPIAMAAYFITQLQAIVSREEDPRDPSVVTVGKIDGGTRRNIIPDSVKLELTTRAFSAHSRQVVIDGLRNMAAGIATSFNLPPQKAPVVQVLEAESTPVTFNNPEMAAKVQAVLASTIGAANVYPDQQVMGSEDVGIFSLDSKIPLVYYWLGAMQPTRFAAAQASGTPLPGPHTSHFEPDPIPTLTTGIRTLTAVSTSLLQ